MVLFKIYFLIISMIALLGCTDGTKEHKQQCLNELQVVFKDNTTKHSCINFAFRNLNDEMFNNGKNIYAKHFYQLLAKFISTGNILGPVKFCQKKSVLSKIFYYSKKHKCLSDLKEFGGNAKAALKFAFFNKKRKDFKKHNQIKYFRHIVKYYINNEDIIERDRFCDKYEYYTEDEQNNCLAEIGRIFNENKTATSCAKYAILNLTNNKLSLNELPYASFYYYWIRFNIISTNVLSILDFCTQITENTELNKINSLEPSIDNNQYITVCLEQLDEFGNNVTKAVIYAFNNLVVIKEETDVNGEKVIKEIVVKGDTQDFEEIDDSDDIDDSEDSDYLEYTDDSEDIDDSEDSDTEIVEEIVNKEVEMEMVYKVKYMHHIASNIVISLRMDEQDVFCTHTIVSNSKLYD